MNKSYENMVSPFDDTKNYLRKTLFQNPMVFKFERCKYNGNGSEKNRLLDVNIASEIKFAEIFGYKSLDSVSSLQMVDFTDLVNPENEQPVINLPPDRGVVKLPEDPEIVQLSPEEIEDPALSAKDRKNLKDAFYEDFRNDLKKISEKIINFTKSVFKNRLAFWLLFDAIPFIAQFLTANSFFETFLFGSEYGLWGSSLIIVFLSYLLSLCFGNVWNLRQLYLFLVYGVLGNLRPYLLYYFFQTLESSIWLPFPDTWLDKIFSKRKTKNFFSEPFKSLPNEKELSIPEINKGLSVETESSKSWLLLKPKPLKEWNIEISFSKPNPIINKRVIPKIENDVHRISIEEMFNF